VNDADHISEERLHQLASDEDAQASKDEDSHLENCKECLTRFIELVNEIRGRRGVN